MRGIVNKRGSYLGGEMRFLDYDNIVPLTTTNQTFNKDGVIYGIGADNSVVIIYINDIEIVRAGGSSNTPIFPVKKGQVVRKTAYEYGGETFAYFIPFLD